MKASELLRQYREGERNFQGVKLRGESLKGQNLSGADFSGADIRGADFTNANLKGAKFCRLKKTGLQDYWITLLLVVTWFLSALLGFITTITCLYTTSILIPKNTQILILVPGLLILVVLSIFFVATIRKSLRFDSRNVFQSLYGAISVTLSTYGAVAAAISLATIVIATLLNFIFVNSHQLIGVSVATTLVAAFISAYAVGLTLAVAGVISISCDLSGLIAVAFAVFGGVVAAKSEFIDRVGFGTIGITVNIIASVMGGNAGWKALKEDETWSATRSVIIFIACLFGTKFEEANLEDTNFEEAILKNTNFNEAKLVRVYLHGVKKIELSRIEGSYLKNLRVRQLLIKGDGENQNFDYQNLRGVNLQGANLANASFKGADMSKANLQGADLSRAKLVQTQLDEANLTGAILTGATIEDWGITSHTKLDGVKCSYVFMRLTTEDDRKPNRRRKPDNWEEEFKDGDFADFIKPIVDTLDLYHNQRVDPRAIAIALKRLAENHPDAKLKIVAMEKRGRDNLLLRLATALGADLSQLNGEYFQMYNEIKALAEIQKKLLAEQDNRISTLENTIQIFVENTVQTLPQRPSYHIEIENYQNKGDTFMADTTKNDFSSGNFSQGLVNVDKSQGNRVDGPIYANHVGGIINNYPPEQKQNLADAAAEIQQLLQQLEQNYPNATEIEKQSALAITLQQEIKQNPTLKARLINALKEGGIEALKVLFGPIGIPIEMVKGWIEAEAS